MTRIRRLLLAESYRHHADGQALLRTPALLQQAATAGADPEKRLLHLADGCDHGETLNFLLDRMLRGLRLFALLMPALGLLFGLLASASALRTGDARQVDALLVLLVLLAPPLLALLWLELVRHWRRRAAADDGRLGLPGLLLTPLLERLLALTGAERADRRAVIRATGGVGGREKLGLRLFTLYSHLLWSGYTAGALLGCLLLLTVSQVDFIWGSTLFDAGPILTLLQVIGWLPGLIGFPVPDGEVLAQTREGAQQLAGGRQQWGWFLFGAVLTYGLLPRLLLGLVALVGLRRASGRLTLDTAEPFYQRLLLDIRRSAGELDRQGAAAPDSTSSMVAPNRFGTGPAFAVVALELDADAGWPPAFTDPRCLALQHIRTRDEVRQAATDLRALAPRPAFLVILVSLLRSPDRGSEHRLRTLIGAADVPTLLLLTESGAFMQRGGDAAQRERDWWQTGKRAGALARLTADHDRLSELSASGLEALLRGAGAKAETTPS